MNTEIFVVSYSKDIPYLEYCLKSIEKFGDISPYDGFYDVKLLVPAQEYEIFLDTCRKWAFKIPLRLRQYDRTPDQVKWQIAAQAEKCRADFYCPDADFVLHLDSDCVFTEPVTPSDYFVDGKPVMLIEEYARLQGCPWQQPTEFALGFKCPYETMRRHPQVNPIGVYEAMRTHIMNHHNKLFLDFVLAQKPTFPWNFTEHNTIGSFALKYFKESYHWIDVGREPWPKHKLAQFWSHSPPHLPQDLPSGGKGCPMETFQRLGLL